MNFFTERNGFVVIPWIRIWEIPGSILGANQYTFVGFPIVAKANAGWNFINISESFYPLSCVVPRRRPLQWTVHSL